MANKMFLKYITMSLLLSSFAISCKKNVGDIKSEKELKESAAGALVSELSRLGYTSDESGLIVNYYKSSNLLSSDEGIIKELCRESAEGEDNFWKDGSFMSRHFVSEVFSGRINLSLGKSIDPSFDRKSISFLRLSIPRAKILGLLTPRGLDYLKTASYNSLKASPVEAQTAIFSEMAGVMTDVDARAIESLSYAASSGSEASRTVVGRQISETAPTLNVTEEFGVLLLNDLESGALKISEASDVWKEYSLAVYDSAQITGLYDEVSYRRELLARFNEIEARHSVRQDVVVVEPPVVIPVPPVVVPPVVVPPVTNPGGQLPVCTSAQVLVSGVCKTDFDGDGIPDDIDPCPQSAAALAIYYKDGDGDGYYAASPAAVCKGADGYLFTEADALGKIDCDDSNPSYSTIKTYYSYVDNDHDGLYYRTQGLFCVKPSAYSLLDPIKDSTLESPNTLAMDIDRDNDGIPDLIDSCPDSVFPKDIYYKDQDGDGYFAASPTTVCKGSNSYNFTLAETGGKIDCDDTNPQYFTSLLYYHYQDLDGDGKWFRTSANYCVKPSDYGAIDLIKEASLESPNTLAMDNDKDNDGIPDAIDACPTSPLPQDIYYKDGDGDGYYVASTTPVCKGDNSFKFTAAVALGKIDCDDTAFSFHAVKTYYKYDDLDGDGLWSRSFADFCVPPSGYGAIDLSKETSLEGAFYPQPDKDFDNDGVIDSLDCAPANPLKFTMKAYYYVDKDGDGYTVPATGQICSGVDLPPGYSVSVGLGLDCDDTSSSKFVVLSGLYIDKDGDGFGTGAPLSLCGADSTVGYATVGGDLNDNDANINPNAKCSYKGQTWPSGGDIISEYFVNDKTLLAHSSVFCAQKTQVITCNQGSFPTAPISSDASCLDSITGTGLTGLISCETGFNLYNRTCQSFSVQTVKGLIEPGSGAQEPSGSKYLSYFGDSISISGDGNVMAIGSPYATSGLYAYGAVFIYRKIGGVFPLVPEKIYTPTPPFSGTQFAGAVALSRDGNTLVVGCTNCSYSTFTTRGLTLVYQYSNGSWSSGAVDYLESGFAFYTNPQFGTTVAVSSDGTYIAVSAPYADYDANGNGTPDPEDFYQSGSVAYYKKENGIWHLLQTIYPDGLSSATRFANFGDALSMSGDGSQLIIGQPKLNGIVPVRPATEIQTSLGGISLYKKASLSETMVFKASLIPLVPEGFGSGPDMGFGKKGAIAVSDDGKTIAAGIGGLTFLNNSLPTPIAGEVQVFNVDSNISWKERPYIIDQSLPAMYEQFGNSLSMSSDGKKLLIGNIGDFYHGEGSLKMFASGAAYLYEKTGSDWIAKFKYQEDESTRESQYDFSSSVAISSDGSFFAISSPLHNGKGGVFVGP